MWEIAANVYREGERDVIYRHCDGEVKAWNATAVEVDGYVPTGNIVVIVCNAGLFTCVDIYRKQRNWEVLRKRISSCDDLRYTLPVVRRLLVREGFDDVVDVVNYIAEYWARQIHRWAQH
ncbi:MAG: hypothetical protein QXT13_08760 [Pyrobaculum sp.]